MPTRPRATHAALAAAALALAACGGSDATTAPADGGATPLSFSFQASGATAGAAASAPGAPLVVAGTAGDTLVITRVQLVLDEVKLKRAGVSAACPAAMPPARGGRSSDDRGCSRVDLGPQLVDVPLGRVGGGFAVTIPAGTYKELEFEIEPVDGRGRDSVAERAFLAANPTFRDVAVRVEGRWRGAPFTFLSRAETEVEFEFEPALAVQAGANDNVTVALDVAAWFRGTGGALLDPTLVANQSRIDAAIANALEARADRDRDGREDGDDRGRGRGKGKGRGTSGGSDD